MARPVLISNHIVAPAENDEFVLLIEVQLERLEIPNHPINKI